MVSLTFWTGPLLTHDSVMSYYCRCEVTSVVSDSVWPHRRQPTRLPRPWDSPGKNTGVGCHFLLQCMSFVKYWFMKLCKYSKLTHYTIKKNHISYYSQGSHQENRFWVAAKFMWWYMLQGTSKVWSTKELFKCNVLFHCAEIY